MSPSSAGGGGKSANIEVERYIGSYLISTTARPKNIQKQKNNNTNFQRTDIKQIKNQNENRNYSPNNNCNDGSGRGGWAGGVPLFSMTSYRNNNSRKTNNNNNNNATGPPRNEKFHQQTQLSRLAIHTHGIPLILAGRNSNTTRKSHLQQQKCSESRYLHPIHEANSNSANYQTPKYNSNVVQNISASDNFKECSPAADTLSVASDESSGSNNSETCLPRIIKPRKRRKKDRKPNVNIEPTENNSDLSVSKIIVAGGGSSDTLPDVPNLNHDFDDIKEVIVPNHCSPTSCQCKLCDPCGQIWNIDSSESLFSYTDTESTPDDDIDVFIVDKMVSALRRSWSDPVSSFTTTNKQKIVRTSSADVGVIGSGRQQSREWHGSSASTTPYLTPQSSLSNSPNLSNNDTNLQTVLQSPKINISTEIVTSPNGHRDLEIKFLSFSSCATTNNDRPNRYDSKSIEQNCDLSYDIGEIGRFLLQIEE